MARPESQKHGRETLVGLVEFVVRHALSLGSNGVEEEA
jgi:hypothetical protein